MPPRKPIRPEIAQLQREINADIERRRADHFVNADARQLPTFGEIDRELARRSGHAAVAEVSGWTEKDVDHIEAVLNEGFHQRSSTPTSMPTQAEDGNDVGHPVPDFHWEKASPTDKRTRARMGEQTSKYQNRVHKPADRRKTEIAIIKSGKNGISCLDICRQMDQKRERDAALAPLSQWIDKTGKRTWEENYKSAKTRSAVQKYVSLVNPAGT